MAGRIEAPSNAGGVAGQTWTLERRANREVVISVAGTAQNPTNAVLNGSLKIPTDVYFEGGPARINGTYANVVLPVPVPNGASAAQTAQLIADTLNLDQSSSLRVATVAGSTVTLPRMFAGGGKGRTAVQEQARVRLARAATVNSVWSAEQPAASTLQSSLGGLDAPAHSLVQCLEKAGFHRGVFDTFATAAKVCAGPSLGPDDELGRVNVVGRALGSDALRAPKDHVRGTDLIRDRGVARRLLSLPLPSGHRAFIGFSPDVDAAGNAREYGRFEFIVERARPNERGDFTDFFVVDSAPNAPGEGKRPQDRLCVSCHQGGTPIFPELNWREFEGNFERLLVRSENEATTRDFAPVTSAQDMPLTSPYQYELTVNSSSERIEGRRWVYWAGLENLSARRELLALSLFPERQAGFSKTPLGKALRERETAGEFKAGAGTLLNRAPDAKVTSAPGDDPLTPRPPSDRGLWSRIDACWPTSHGVLREGVVAIIGASQLPAFLESHALAHELAERWPPLAEDVLSAAREFAKKPSKANGPVLESKVAEQAAAARALRAANDARAKIFSSFTPKNPGEALGALCLECHHEGGLVPVLKPDAPAAGGKYEHRSLVNMVTQGLMPPGFSTGQNVTAELAEQLKKFLKTGP